MRDASIVCGGSIVKDSVIGGGSVVRRSQIENSKIEGCEIVDCDIRGGKFQGMVLRGGIWRGGDFMGRNGDGDKGVVVAMSKEDWEREGERERDRRTLMEEQEVGEIQVCMAIIRWAYRSFWHVSSGILLSRSSHPLRQPVRLPRLLHRYPSLRRFLLSA